MKEESEIMAPSHCFCEIPDDEMRPWVEKKFRDHQTTVELINSTDDAHQREIISIVGLFDVDEETMLEMMGGVDKPTHHIIHCREQVKQMLGLDAKNEKN